MVERTHSQSVYFNHPFSLPGIDRLLPSGSYRVVTDEELLDGLSFPVYRRTATLIFLPAESHLTSSTEMCSIDPRDLQAALLLDAAVDEWLNKARRDGSITVSSMEHKAHSVTDKSINLDQHRGMAAQKATDLRRLLAEVEANERALRLQQEALETHLVAAPAANWHEAAEKAGYLLNLFATAHEAQDPRRQRLIAAVLADFARLAGEE